MNTPVGPIVVGYDDRPAARSALKWAAERAETEHNELIVVYVSSAIAELEFAAVQIDTNAIRSTLEAQLNGDWTADLRSRKIRYRTEVAIGRAAAELMRIARAESASLIVIGMTGRGTLAELVFGSADHELLRHALRPVVAVPASWTPKDATSTATT